jgi:hypothetical protein
MHESWLKYLVVNSIYSGFNWKSYRRLNEQLLLVVYRHRVGLMLPVDGQIHHQLRSNLAVLLLILQFELTIGYGNEM